MAGRPPLCPNCGAPPGAASPSPKSLLLGVGWIAGTIAAASHFWLSQPKWAERLAAASILGVLPVLFFLRGLSRSGSYWRCLRCRHEWLRRGG